LTQYHSYLNILIYLLPSCHLITVLNLPFLLWQVIILSCFQIATAESENSLGVDVLPNAVDLIIVKFLLLHASVFVHNEHFVVALEHSFLWELHRVDCLLFNIVEPLLSFFAFLVWGDRSQFRGVNACLFWSIFVNNGGLQKETISGVWLKVETFTRNNRQDSFHRLFDINYFFERLVHCRLRRFCGSINNCFDSFNVLWFWSNFFFSCLSLFLSWGFNWGFTCNHGWYNIDRSWISWRCRCLSRSRCFTG